MSIKTIDEIRDIPGTEFNEIEIDFDDNEIADIVQSYVKRKLESASISVFESHLSEGSTIEEALYQAIFNDAVLEAIRAGMEYDEGNE